MSSLVITEPSVQLVTVYAACSFEKVWLTNHDIAALASNTSERCVRSCTQRLASVGVLEQLAVFGGFRYRLKQSPDAKARQLVARIHRAAEAFGVVISPD